MIRAATPGPSLRWAREDPGRGGGSIRVIGVGNEYRGDDGVGVRVAQAMAVAGVKSGDILTLGARDGTALLSAWEGADVVYVVDAVSAPMPSGAIVRLEVRRGTVVSDLRTLSSHGFGLGEAVAFGQALGMMPRRLVIYGIVGRNFGHGQGLSPEVAQAARSVLGRLRRAVTRQGHKLA